MKGLPSRRSARLVALLERLREGPRTRRELARAFGCSIRTIARMRRELEESFGVEIEYDARRGYRLRSRRQLVPPGGEFLADAAVAAELLRGMRAEDIGDRLRRALDEVGKQVDHRVRRRIERLSKRVTARPPPGRKPAPGVLPLVLEALADGRPIRCTYASASEGVVRSRELWPVYVAWLAGEWYLFAVPYRRDATPRELRQFSLARIDDAEPIAGSGDDDPPDTVRHLRKRFRRFVPPDPKASVEWLKVRFSPEAVPWLEGWVFHEDQSVRRHRDGSITVSFPAPSRFEALRFVLSYGPTIEVLEPKELRDAAAEAARRIARLYERPRPAPDDPVRLWPDGLFDL